MMLSYPKAIGSIVVSLIVVTGSAHILLRSHQRKNIEKRLTNNFRIHSIIQPKRILPTDYLAELMHLSKDKQTRLTRFNIEKATKRLLQSPHIYDVRLEPKKPNSIIVDCKVREPLIALGEFENLAIDESGTPFPITPYFSPKRLPELYLGLNQTPPYNKVIDHPSLELAHAIFALTLEYRLPITRIDVSKAKAPSLGQREVVVMVDGHTLRLNPRNYAQELANYMELRPDLLGVGSQIIDLRLASLAFIGDE